jgi:hypothetical protein
VWARSGGERWSAIAWMLARDEASELYCIGPGSDVAAHLGLCYLQ